MKFHPKFKTVVGVFNLSISNKHGKHHACLKIGYCYVKKAQNKKKAQTILMESIFFQSFSLVVYLNRIVYFDFEIYKTFSEATLILLLLCLPLQKYNQLS